MIQIVVAVSFTLMLLFNMHTYAWHENLGIDANKAAELYQTKPNDPAIVQWKNALQLAINGMGKCLNLETAISCESLMSTIISNCNSHPDELIACNDKRIVEQKRLQEAPIEDLVKEFTPRVPENALSIIIKSCIERSNSSSRIELTSCYNELSSLQRDCEIANSSYSYCKDKGFIDYLAQHNSTVSSYSYLTGNSSSPNSTYP